MTEGSHRATLYCAVFYSPAVRKYKQDAENEHFLLGAYKTYTTKKKRKFDKVLRRIL